VKIKQIKKISSYKSFRDFSWGNFIKSKNFHDSVNIFYGENGSGKSSICNIFKSVSQDKDFVKYFPDEVSLVFEDGDKKYTVDDGWDTCVSKGTMLFFDREFVDKNIHLGHKRGTKAQEHEQESGKLIVEFDNEAIELRKARKEAKEEKDKWIKLHDEFLRQNKEIFEFNLSEEEKLLYQKFNDTSKDGIEKIKQDLLSQKREAEKELDTDKGRQKKVLEIQDIREMEEVGYEIELSDYDTYQAIFNYDLKEQAKEEVQKNLVEKLKEHKSFFETGIEIRKKHPAECPFCQSRTEEENIEKVIEAYGDIFDETYSFQVQKFQVDKQELIDELESLITEILDFNLNSIFLKLKTIEEKFKIKEVYSVEEETKYKKPNVVKLKELKTKLASLEKPNKEDLQEIYQLAEAEFKEIEGFFSDISGLVESKNKLIRFFKEENTDEKLQKRIEEQTEKIESITKELSFLNDNKIGDQRNKIKKEQEKYEIIENLDKARQTHKDARKKYEDYCVDDIFTKPLSGMLEYFKKFNFNFTLELEIEKRKTGATKEFPFAFKVIDSKGNERDFNEGLSEGELQVLSLCFFFAFLDIQADTQDKILVFDDPITSLDNSNLSCLVDLIAEEQDKFSQTFIYSHHRTFFKFLCKKFRHQSSQYNILRNKDEFGGSFVCESEKKKFLKKLKKFEEHLQRIPPQSLDVELKVVEYGQYLRYEVERFIKNDLLYWNTQTFASAIDGIKKNKAIDDTDLDTIKNVYSFCNWTTSHIDVGDDHGLEQLKRKIADFVAIVN